MAKRSSRRATPAWGISLQCEHDGPFGYRYRRLSVERVGRRASVREFVFSFGRDPLAGPRLHEPNRLVSQRVRALSPIEAETLWDEVERLRPRLRPTYLTLGDPRDLDTSRDLDGAPLAILTGEEGPACLTLRRGRPEGGASRRVLVQRFPRVAPEAGEQRTALRELVDLLEPGLTQRPLNRRRSFPVEDLCGEFLRLKASDFLNLRRFEGRALEVLGQLGDPAGIPTVAGELFAADPDVRIQALEALVALAEEDARSEVELLCYDEDPRVRARARALLS